MKFLRFVSRLNVFATIRSLREDLTFLAFDNADLQMSNEALSAELYATRKDRADFRAAFKRTNRDLQNANQAISHFMDEREELKRGIHLRDVAGEALLEMAKEQRARIVELEAQIDAAAGMMAERDAQVSVFVGHVNDCEAALAAAGITVKLDEGATFPTVSVNTPTLIDAVNTGKVRETPEPTAMAA